MKKYIPLLIIGLGILLMPHISFAYTQLDYSQTISLSGVQNLNQVWVGSGEVSSRIYAIFQDSSYAGKNAALLQYSGGIDGTGINCSGSDVTNYFGTWTDVGAFGSGELMYFDFGTPVTFSSGLCNNIDSYGLSGTHGYLGGVTSINDGVTIGGVGVSYGGAVSESNNPMAFDFDGSFTPPPAIMDIQQYKSDGVASLGEGSTTMENSIVIKGTLESSSSDPLLLQVEFSTSTGSFANPIIVTSTPVISGEIASTTIAGLADGDYHWQAQVVDASTRATSSWQAQGNPATPTDFTVHQVPLITQFDTRWGALDYASGSADFAGSCGLSIAQCGCAISSVAMVAQYYGVDAGIDGNPTNPLFINAWLESSSSNGGYTADGDVNWDIAADYANDVSAGIKLQHPTILAAVTDGTALDSDLNQDLNLLEPAIIHSDTFGHFFVADDQLAATYAINDPAWYLTKTLDDDEGNTSTTRDYDNDFNSIHLYTAVPENTAMTQDEYITLSSPGQLLITDPDGNQLGVDPITSATYSNITGSVYSSEGISDATLADPGTGHETKYAWISNPVSGNYNIQVIGTGSGDYTLQAISHDASGTVHNEITTGSTTPNQINGYDLNFTPSEPNDITLEPSITFATSTYTTGKDPEDIAFDSHTNTVWTANYGTGTVTQINDTTHATSSYAVGSLPFGIAFDSNTNTIWVTHSGGTVTQINDTTYATSTYAVGSNLYGAVFDPHTNTIWVADYGKNAVTQINDTTHATSSYSVGTDPEYLAFDSHTNTVWVANTNAGTVTQINDTTYATSTYAVGSAGGIAFDPNTNSVWVANTAGTGTVTQINDTTYATSSYPLEASPYNIAFDPHTDSLWVTDRGLSGFVGQINDMTHVTSTYSVGATPFGIAFDSNTNAIWVGNTITAGTVTVLTPSR